MKQTISSIFDSYDAAAAAVQRLQAAGIARDDISIISNDADMSRDSYGEFAVDAPTEGAAEGAGTGAGIGAVVGGGAGLLAGLGLIAIPGLGPVVAAGWLAATLVGAGAGVAAGGIVGALVGSGVDEDTAHAYAEGVRHGGTLVSVRVDARDHDRIQDVLDERSFHLDAARKLSESPDIGDRRDAPVRREEWPGRYHL
jgi:hypothetical protein